MNLPSEPSIISVLLTLRREEMRFNLSGESADTFAQAMRAMLQRPIEAAGVASPPTDFKAKVSTWSHCKGDQTLLFFTVTDTQRAWPIIRQKLDSVGLLGVARIVWSDLGRYRLIHPEGGKPFNPCSILDIWTIEANQPNPEKS